MSGDIFLNIDTIVLRGLNHVDRQALTEALQQALIEQLSSNPTLTDTNLSRVRTNITLPTAFGAEQLGQMLGQSLSGIVSRNEDLTNSTHNTKQGGRSHA